MLAYRLVHDVKVFKLRSFCPKCNKMIHWYDNIPVLSWLYLRGRCRQCSGSITFLYPFIEVLSAVIFVFLFYKIPFPYFFSYFIFFSALIITIRSDLETMLISRLVTIYLIPVAIVLSIINILPLTLSQVMLGSLFGYFLLFMINKVFEMFTGKQGIGEGDFELLAFIGSFTGIQGCWMTLLVASILGSISGIFLILIGKMNISNKIPFGPFLAIAAILFVLFKNPILSLILGN